MKAIIGKNDKHFEFLIIISKVFVQTENEHITLSYY